MAGTRSWFLKIDPAWIFSIYVCVCLCECPPPRLLITSGVLWHDIDPIWLVKQDLQLVLYMTTIAVALIGVALALFHIMETNSVRVS